MKKLIGLMLLAWCGVATAQVQKAIPPGTIVGVLPTTSGQTAPSAIASLTGSISGNTLTVTAVGSGGGGTTNVGRFQLGGTSSTAFSLIPNYGQLFTLGGGNYQTTSGGRAVNTGTTSDTVAAGESSTYESANTSLSVFTLTLAAPTKDGERRRICFANATGTVTWSVASPATATAGLPTTFLAGGCTEIVYNSASGTPTNAPATTWLPY